MSAELPEFAAGRSMRTDRPTGDSSDGERLDECRADFGDTASQHVLASAALAVARELGRQAAREYFQDLVQLRRPS